jgi:hypothetical protein
MVIMIMLLLQVLPHLQQLEQLTFVRVCSGVMLQPLSPAAFGALTASSKLNTFEFLGAALPTDALYLPPGALVAMFGGSKQLPAVTKLVLSTVIPSGRSHTAPTDPQASHWSQRDRILGTAELHAIAGSCPGLHSLLARGCVQPDTDWSALQQLQHLTQLTVSSVSDAGAGGLATLVRLSSLSVTAPGSNVSMSGMQQLTALRSLTYLKIESDDGDCPRGGWVYTSKVRCMHLKHAGLDVAATRGHGKDHPSSMTELRLSARSSCAPAGWQP